MLDKLEGPLLARSAFDWEHDIMYKANAQIVCYMPDLKLIKAVVRLYGIWGALKDAVQKHDAEVEKYRDIQMAAEKLGVKKHQLEQIEKSIDILTKMMQSCYEETTKQVDLVLQKLNNEIVLC